MTLPAWVDGRVVDAATARVSALDLGLRSGIGVFETLRVRSGRTFRLDRHLERARVGAEGLGFELVPDELARAVDELLDELAARRGVLRETLDDLVVRVTVTAGPVDADATFPPAALGRPTRVVTVHPAAPLPLPPLGAITVQGRRPLAATKSTSYAFAHRAAAAARAEGAGLALLIEDGLVTEAANGNVLAIRDGVLVAPPPGERALDGITRAVLVELVGEGAVPGLTVEQRDLAVGDLGSADALLVSSAVAGLVDVIAIDGRAVGIARDGSAGRSTVAALRAALDALIDQEARPPDRGRGRH